VLVALGPAHAAALACGPGKGRLEDPAARGAVDAAGSGTTSYRDDEVYVIVPLARMGDTTALANVVARGISAQAWDVPLDAICTERDTLTPSADPLEFPQ